MCQIRVHPFLFYVSALPTSMSLIIFVREPNSNTMYHDNFGRMVINLCLGVDVAESEDEKFGVVYAVEFSPERLDFRID